MLKATCLLLSALASAGSLFAQTEPQKSPAAAATASLPPNVHDAAKNPAAQAPPPAGSTGGAGQASTSDSAKPQVEKNPPPLDPKNMDTSVDPSKDFYLYANGGWIKRNPIPPEFARWGSFNELTEKNNDALHEICENVSKKQTDTKIAPEVQKVSDFYGSGMNEEAVNAAKVAPLNDELKRIDAIKERKDILNELAHLHATGVGAFFGFTSGQDDKNSTMVIAQAFQGGLGLPDRDYYTKEDEGSKKLRDQYVQHVTKMLTLAGEAADAAGKDAQKILALETSLAQASRTKVELRDPQKNYNKMKQDELQKLTPDWNWQQYFSGINLKEPGEINVGQP